MSAKQHTPGPWTQGTSEVGVTCVWLNGLTEPEDKMGPDHTWIDCGTEANARLIAAAPELLDALKELLDREWQDDEGDYTLEMARRKARAAIAKAIG